MSTLAEDNPLLELRGFGVRLYSRPILREISLSFPARGVTAIMGPGGSGKSTLLRSISGLNDDLAHATFEGSIRYRGQLWPEGPRPAIVVQKPRMAMASTFDFLVDGLPQRGELTRLEQRAHVEDFLRRHVSADLTARLDDELLTLTRAEKSRVAILRQLLLDPAMLCVDEPTADLEDDETAPLLTLLERERERRAVVLVTHNQRRARRVADRVVLLAGGRVIEQAPTETFFTSPQTDEARSYVRTGGCDVPSLGALAATSTTLEESTQPGTIHQVFEPALEAPTAQLSLEELLTPAHGARAEAVGPRDFRWLVPGRLAGVPQPGLLHDLDRDLEALARAGVDHLVTLTEEPLSILVDLGHGISNSFFPIDDMHAPSIERAMTLCEQIAELLTRGVTVAFHCKAGIGRTGTMLGATLVWHGMDGKQALRTLRRVYQRWVQSREQELFLESFAEHLRGREFPRTTSPPRGNLSTPMIEKESHDVA